MGEVRIRMGEVMIRMGVVRVRMGLVKNVNKINICIYVLLHTEGFDNGIISDDGSESDPEVDEFTRRLESENKQRLQTDQLLQL